MEKKIELDNGDVVVHVRPDNYSLYRTVDRLRVGDYVYYNDPHKILSIEPIVLTTSTVTTTAPAPAAFRVEMCSTATKEVFSHDFKPKMFLELVKPQFSFYTVAYLNTKYGTIGTKCIKTSTYRRLTVSNRHFLRAVNKMLDQENYETHVVLLKFRGNESIIDMFGYNNGAVLDTRALCPCLHRTAYDLLEEDIIFIEGERHEVIDFTSHVHLSQAKDGSILSTMYLKFDFCNLITNVRTEISLEVSDLVQIANVNYKKYEMLFICQNNNTMNLWCEETGKHSKMIVPTVDLARILFKMAQRSFKKIYIITVQMPKFEQIIDIVEE
ncbi:hypothetical protein GQ42DRAFT_155602 [Ramicandelaber brevisporus]|nr:hypothetical protein GQ42DRAFT_155602 [Ramicandelaber brevisporus]